ncbi:hypothetical protein [Synechococcus elongatus]|uniref:hypothetical protein n=1 Tax=Synechococcus elongatus TaxID=32046 RepID=UPI0030D161EA
MNKTSSASTLVAILGVLVASMLYSFYERESKILLTKEERIAAFTYHTFKCTYSVLYGAEQGLQRALALVKQEHPSLTPEQLELVRQVYSGSSCLEDPQIGPGYRISGGTN